MIMAKGQQRKNKEEQKSGKKPIPVALLVLHEITRKTDNSRP